MQIRIVMFLLLGAFLVTGAAYAESVTGKVQSVDPATKLIKVAQIDSATGAEKEVSIWVKEATAFEGVADLASLQEGAEVSIEASADEASGNLQADSVTVTEAEEAPAV